ncbi:MAG: hypothetical protein K5883_09570 [Pseudobutyrivibrio sp.]|nr:hypothetical protein [Pseudobutyrivibrio sp.]
MKDETRAFKAKQLRYKRPISRDLNLERIRSDLWEMLEACGDVHWYDDDDSLVAALNGDEDDAYEFKMSFCDLEAELERFRYDLEQEYVTAYFDLLFPAVGADYAGGYLGYDASEEDYFGLEPYEYAFAESEASKKMMSLTKKELLEAVGSCLKVVHQYIAIKYRYDCLDAAIETLRAENLSKIKLVKGIEEAYARAQESSYQFQVSNKDVADLDRMLSNVPQVYWVQ